MEELHFQLCHTRTLEEIAFNSAILEHIYTTFKLSLTIKKICSNY